jgi:hemerythrin-like domain-containing protein
VTVQIGQGGAHNFDQPLGLLSDCHRRIERFLDVLATVANGAPGGELSGEQRIALTGALKYFRDAAPKHTADEEVSLFPRLRAASDPEVAGVLAEVDRLEADHTRADELHRRVDELGMAWLENGTLPQESAAALCGAIQTLRGIYRAHIAAEDTLVFPMAGRVLERRVQEEIGREMAARRSVTITQIG